MFTRLTRLAFVLMAVLAAPLHADDTEIYLGADLTDEVKPNVLFIIDTSGSMTRTSPQDKYTMVWVDSEYDAGTTYDGPCDTGKLYWTTATTTLPTCAGATKWLKNDEAYNTCRDSWSRLATDGKYTNSFGMWNASSRSWASPGTTGQTWKWECYADYPTHGEVEGDGRPYPTNSSVTGWSGSYDRRKVYKPSTGVTLYTGNYLNYRAAGGVAGGWMTRLQTVQYVLKKLLDTVSGVNVGIMRFNKDAQGGYMLTPMLELTDANREILKKYIDDGMGDNGYTPLAETLYEATRYFRGEAPMWGTTTYGPGSNPATISGGKYISPIKYQCQKSYIVYFSDGSPTQDGSSDGSITSQTDYKRLYPSNCWFSEEKSDCLAEQAGVLRHSDLSGSFNDQQYVTTYTIGFEWGLTTFGKALLPATASAGGGQYYPTTSANEITDAFTAVMTNILSESDSFTAPAVTVNAFNRLTFLDELYYAVFLPTVNPKWDGNIKRYRLGIPDGGTALTILDVNGDQAIDPGTGFFKESATSYWPAKDASGMTVVDGRDVTLGGAASHMPAPNDRKVFTCCYGSTALTATANKLHESNANITDTTLGAASAAERTTILQWGRGVDLWDVDGDGDLTDARLQLSDPLHTEPQLVTYGMSGGEIDMTLYAPTNEGFLHAINTRTGVEQFAFIPKDLLGQLRPQALNDKAVDHPYGLDGPLSTWVYDKDYDGTIELPTDHVYLYATMRRGGRNIYALNASDRLSPSFMWSITGGSGSFSELAYTFSKASYGKVKLNGVAKDVLFFGGGYDLNQDGNDIAEDDGMGRAIYMVDAKTGLLLWRAGPDAGANLQLADMTNSIPSDIKVIDLEGDGYTDRLYVGDMRGRIWRIDLSITNTGSTNLATGGIIAKLGEEGTKAGNRRFFYPPSVSLSTTGNYVNIAIGSGHREHPLNTDIYDKFYVLRDPYVKGPEIAGGAATYTLLEDFVDATTWLTGGAVNKSALDASDGYYINLMKSDGTWEGEKVLAPAITINGIVIFTTFTPVSVESAKACSPSRGTAKEYVMNIEDSTAVRGTARETLLTHGGIPPRPVAITTDEGSAVIIGTNLDNTNLARDTLKKSTWSRK